MILLRRDVSETSGVRYRRCWAKAASSLRFTLGEGAFSISKVVNLVVTPKSKAGQ